MSQSSIYRVLIVVYSVASLLHAEMQAPVTQSTAC